VTAKTQRRRFLKGSAVVVGGIAINGIRPVSAQDAATPDDQNWSMGYEPGELPRDLREYGRRSRYVTSKRTYKPRGGRATNDVFTPLQDIEGIITPASLHFNVNHGSAIPDIDPAEHRLMIHGMVERPLIFTMEELKKFPSVTRPHFVECAYNAAPPERRSRDATVQRTHGQTSCSLWTGVPLSVLLKETGVHDDATWIVAEGAEAKKRTKSMPLQKAMADAIVAYGQNGEPVRPEQGFPLRLVVPGYEGPANVKWLRRIKLGDQPWMAHADNPGHTTLRPDGKGRWFQFEMGVNSVITNPSGGQRLPDRGFHGLTGLAWSGGGAIRKVEVSIDGGRTWNDAQLQEPIHRFAHTRFFFPWNWNGGEAILQSRAIDEQGDVQPSLQDLNNIYGVNSDYWLSIRDSRGHFNPIQPWKVTSDGNVYNAIWEV
jgi:sulfane dehydrogenase subunit SoxC